MLNAIIKVIRIIIFLAFSLSFIFSTSASGFSSGSTSQPFIFDGTVRSMVKQSELVGSTYDVESTEWGMTFQVSVMPGYGDVDGSIRVGDKVQVCGERGTGINQTLVYINKGNHYIRRTGLATSPFSKQPDTPQSGQVVTPTIPGTPATPPAGTSGSGCINDCQSRCQKACTPKITTQLR